MYDRVMNIAAGLDWTDDTILRVLCDAIQTLNEDQRSLIEEYIQGCATNEDDSRAEARGS